MGARGRDGASRDLKDNDLAKSHEGCKLARATGVGRLFWLSRCICWHVHLIAAYTQVCKRGTGVLYRGDQQFHI